MKLKDLTPRLADKLVFEKWNWHIKHPSKGSGDWGRWKRNGGDVPEMECFCPYCQLFYYNLHPNKSNPITPYQFDCNKKCPLVQVGQMCEKKGNWYDKWRKAKSPKTRKKYATLIRDVAGERLGEDGR